MKSRRVSTVGGDRKPQAAASCRHQFLFVVREEGGNVNIHCMTCRHDTFAPRTWSVHKGYHEVIDFTLTAHNSQPRNYHEFARQVL